MDRKNKSIRMRVSESEYAEIKLKAETSQHRNLSVYGREILLGNTVYSFKSIVADETTRNRLLKISYLLKHIIANEHLQPEARKKLSMAWKDLEKIGVSYE